MVNILIAENNIGYVKNIMQLINSNFNNARISNISTSGYETMELLKKSTNIDIILLELFMPDIGGIEIIDKLSSFQENKYKNSIIILANNNNLLKQFNGLKGKSVYYSLKRKSDLELLIQSLGKLITEKDLNNASNDLKRKITIELTSLKYSLSHSGTKYLIDTIEIIYLSEDNLTINLSKNIYPIIAKRYNQTCNNVKISILRATESMYYNCREKKLMEYFDLENAVKPNIKTIIQKVISNIRILQN